MSKNWRIWQERPYNDDSIASRLLSEVKHRLAWLVLRWGTTLESQVLFFCNLAFAGQPPYHTHINYIFIHDSICTTHGRYTAPKIHPVWYFSSALNCRTRNNSANVAKHNKKHGWPTNESSWFSIDDGSCFLILDILCINVSFIDF